MPIFEYRCVKCDSVFDHLHKSSANLDEVVCPNCKSIEVKKLMSSFASSFSIKSSDSCSSGNCGVANSGGCANGMCNFD